MERDPQLLADLLDHEPTDAELPELLQRVRDTGALDRALAWARGRVDAGLSELDVLPESSARDALRVLGRYLVERAA